MNDKVTYKKESTTVPFEKKLFIVTNYYPEYTQNERKTVSTDVENQLFTVFQQYPKKGEPDDV